MATKPPRRVAARPDPQMWSPDEMMTFAEAAALFWPDGGPLTASSLRTAYRAGQLETTMIARKLMTTKDSIAAMMKAASRPARERS